MFRIIPSYYRKNGDLASTRLATGRMSGPYQLSLAFSAGQDLSDLLCQALKCERFLQEVYARVKNTMVCNDVGRVP